MNLIPNPINRPDGRHWCNPASADTANGDVVCPDCGRVWSVEDGVWFEKAGE